MPDLFSLYDLASRMKKDLDTATATQARIRATNYLRLELAVEFDPAALVLADRVSRWTTYVRLTGPLGSVESVTVDGTVLASPGDYEVTRRGLSIPNGLGSGATEWVDLEVAYTAGFAAIPGELADWGMYLGAQAYDELAKVGVASTAIAADGVSEQITYDNGDDGTGDAVSLPEPVLRNLRHKYGSGRPRAGTVRLR